MPLLLSIVLLFTMMSSLAAIPVVPQPREVKELAGTVDLARAKWICFSPADNEAARSYAGELGQEIKSRTGREIPVKPAAARGFEIRIGTIKSRTEKDEVQNAEGYTLKVCKDGIDAHARSAQGLFYATRTIKQLMESCGTRIPECSVRDWPDITHRAVMIDMARLMERHDYYFELIDFLAQRKINTVYLHFSDDGHCGLEYKSKPEITTPYAFTREEMKKLISYAGERHVEIIPEVESWGHASYILNHEKYADLRESKGTLCTMKPGTWEVLDDLYRETASLFPSRYMHIGCDESEFGKCPDCKAYAEKNGMDALVGKHLQMVCELAQKHGKTPILWGDVLLRFRGAIDVLPKDAVIAHWNYKAEVKPEPSEFLSSKGFTTIGCPALVWGGRMILPHGDAFENISSFAAIVRKQKLMGMSTTVWVPSRYINDSLWYGLAYASGVSWSGSKFDENSFGKAFFKEFYGIEATPELLRQARMAHNLGLGSSNIFTNMWNYRGQYDKLSKPSLLCYTIPHRDKSRACVRTLKQFQTKATRHKEEYGAFLLAAELIELASDQAVAAGTLSTLLEKAKAGDKKALSDAISLLDSLTARRERAIAGLSRFWDRRRYENDPQKYGGGQNVVGSFFNERDYLPAISSKLKDIRTGKSSDWENVMQRP